MINFLKNAPQGLKTFRELFDYAVNLYKQRMGVFPEGIDKITIQRQAANLAENRQKIIEFPKEKITNPFKPRPGEFGITTLDDAGKPIKTTTGETPESLMEKLVKMTNENLKKRGLGNIKLGDDLPPPKNKKPAVDPELQKAEDMKKEFEDFSIRNLTPIEAMKEASSLIGRKGKYKNISESDAKKLLDELDEKIKSDMGPIQSEGDDIFAGGGRVGFGSGSVGAVGLAGNQVEPSQMQGPPVATGVMATPEGMTAEEFAMANPTRRQILNPPGPATQPPVRMQGAQMGGLDFLVPMTVGKKFPGSGGINELKQLLGFFGAQDMGVGVNIPTSRGMITPAVSPRTGDLQVTARGSFKDGSKPKSPGRRTFMKTMAGLASIPVVGKLFKPAAKVAETAGPAIAEGVKLGFDKFMMLVDKIKRLGRPADNLATQERQKVIRYEGKDGSEYELVEDLSTGDLSITKDKPGIAVYGRGTDDVEGIDVIEDRSTFYLRRGQADETTKGKTPPDEYDEAKLEAFDGETFDAVDDVTDKTVKEILEELDVPRTKKAGGGLAYMLGE